MKKAKIVTDKQQKDVCFEEALGKLELIVKELEKGELSLQDSLEKFAEGVTMSRICLAKLSAAEEQIDKILQQVDNELIEKPLVLREDEKC